MNDSVGSQRYSLPMHNAWVRSMCEDTGHVVEAEGSKEESFGLDDGIVKAGPLVCHGELDSGTQRLLSTMIWHRSLQSILCRVTARSQPGVRNADRGHRE